MCLPMPPSWLEVSMICIFKMDDVNVKLLLVPLGSFENDVTI